MALRGFGLVFILIGLGAALYMRPVTVGSVGMGTLFVGAGLFIALRKNG